MLRGSDVPLEGTPHSPDAISRSRDAGCFWRVDAWLWTERRLAILTHATSTLLLAVAAAGYVAAVVLFLLGVNRLADVFICLSSLLVFTRFALDRRRRLLDKGGTST